MSQFMSIAHICCSSKQICLPSAPSSLPPTHPSVWLCRAECVSANQNARNVLLSSSGVTALGVMAKLADLGLSRIVRSHRSHHSTNTVGTMSHVAPGELALGGLGIVCVCGGGEGEGGGLRVCWTRNFSNFRPLVQS